MPYNLSYDVFRRSQGEEVPMFDLRSADDEAMIRLRLAPSDARYAGNLVPGSKAMEIFADLETELALREGGVRVGGVHRAVARRRLR